MLNIENTLSGFVNVNENEDESELESKQATKTTKETFHSHIYLVFPALEDVVTESLQKKHQRVFTMKLKGYHKANDNRVKESQTIENGLWATIQGFDQVYESMVFTNDLYVENVLNEHHIKYTVVYPETANQSDYLSLLKEKGYKDDMLTYFKKNWSSFIKAIPSSLDVQGVFTNYIKGVA